LVDKIEKKVLIRKCPSLGCKKVSFRLTLIYSFFILLLAGASGAGCNAILFPPSLCSICVLFFGACNIIITLCVVHHTITVLVSLAAAARFNKSTLKLIFIT
jgi:hypothetical protein